MKKLNLLAAIAVLFGSFSSVEAADDASDDIGVQIDELMIDSEGDNNEGAEVTERALVKYDPSVLEDDDELMEEVEDEVADEEQRVEEELVEEDEGDLSRILATVFTQSKFYMDNPSSRNSVDRSKNRSTKRKFNRMVKARLLYDNALQHEKKGGRKRIFKRGSATSRLKSLVNSCKDFCTYDRCGGTSQNDARVFNACAYYCEPARMQIKQCFRNVRSFYPEFRTDRAGLPVGMNYDLRQTTRSKAKERTLGAGEAAKQEIANVLDAMQAKRIEIGGIKGAGAAIGAGVKMSGKRFGKGIRRAGGRLRSKFAKRALRASDSVRDTTSAISSRGIRSGLGNVASRLSSSFGGLKLPGRCGCQKPAIEMLEQILEKVEDTNAATHHVLQFVEEIQSSMRRKRQPRLASSNRSSGMTIEEIEDGDDELLRIEAAS